MIVTKYQCSGCAQIYSIEFKAAECCPNFEEISVCSLCGNEFDEFEDVPTHCDCEMDGEGAVKLAPQKVLESHGQQRMF